MFYFHNGMSLRNYCNNKIFPIYIIIDLWYLPSLCSLIVLAIVLWVWSENDEVSQVMMRNPFDWNVMALLSPFVLNLAHIFVPLTVVAWWHHWVQLRVHDIFFLHSSFVFVDSFIAIQRNIKECNDGESFDCSEHVIWKHAHLKQHVIIQTTLFVLSVFKKH